MSNPQRFGAFIAAFSALVDADGADERRIFDAGGKLLADLVRHDDWLPEAFARPGADSYRQYLLYRDPRARFSVVSFVWGPGQRTPIHDHTVWGMVGVMRGEERCEEYDVPTPGRPMTPRGSHPVRPGEVDFVSPRVGDIHVVSNALPDRPSISIHVYGADIGAVSRHVYDPATGAPQAFVSGYHGAAQPGFWDRPAGTRAPGG